jgi:rfaE bifunctional protein nucleotidyltransferase chain/domain
MKLKDKIVSMNVAQSMVNQWQKQGDKVVFTNGCFDILHAGHVHYLEEARCLGNKLVIGLNTDQSIQRLDKSPARPIQSQDSRAMVLAALDSVSLVVLFDEDTPKELIETLNPNILVKGADYQIDQIVGGSHVIANGGEVKTLEFLPDYSTSKIEQKILKSHGK